MTLFAGLVAFGGLLLSDAASIATSPPGRARVDSINLLIALAAGSVAFVPIVWRGGRSGSARRFDLLPFPPARRMLLRLIADGPVAICAGGLAMAIMAGVVVGRLGDSPTLLAVHLVSLAALFGLAVLASDVLANHIGNRFPNLAFWPALALALLSLQGLAGFRMFSRPAPGAVTAPYSLTHVIELRPSAPLAGAAVVALVAVALGLALVWVEIHISAKPPRSGRSSTPRGRDRFGRTPLSRKEWAYVVRPTISRNAIVVTLVVILGSLVLRQPALHVVAFCGWMLYAQNIFAYDLPLGGDHRYRIAPRPLHDVIHARERAMWMVVAVPFAVLSVPALVFVPFDRWLLGWAALVWGSGMFYLAALFGRFASQRSARAIELSTIVMHSGTIAGIGYLAIGAVITISGVITIAIYTWLSGWPMARMPAIGIAVGSLGLALLAVYGVVAHWERARGQLLFEPVPASGD